jgi:hypothetical protein
MTGVRIGLPLHDSSSSLAAKMAAPVKLDMDDATLSDILLSACKQTGTIFYVPEPGGTNNNEVEVRPGDMAIDRRPFVDLGDYVIRATGVQSVDAPGIQFRWAQPLGAPQPEHWSAVDLEITVRTFRGVLHLAGVSDKWRAVFDHGPTLSPPTGHGGPGYVGMGGPWNMYIGTMPTLAPFPLFPKAATKIARLEGALVEYSDARATELRFAPGKIGQTVTQGDVSFTLTQWKEQDRWDIRLHMTARYPGLPGNEAGVNNWVTVTLVGKDGRRYTDYAVLEYGRGDGTYNLDARLSRNTSRIGGQPQAPGVAPIEPDYVLVTLVRVGPADRRVPLVIENIPLP